MDDDFITLVTKTFHLKVKFNIISQYNIIILGIFDHKNCGKSSFNLAMLCVLLVSGLFRFILL